MSPNHPNRRRVKTVVLDDEFRASGNRIEHQHREYTGDNWDDVEISWRPTIFSVGATVTLGVSEYVGPSRGGAYSDKPSYFLAGPQGIPGNSDRHNLQTSGWRGTTDDVSITALGLAMIVAVWTGRDGNARVRVRLLDNDRR